MIREADFCANVYGQFEQGVAAGVSPIGCMLPVDSAASNRITLAAQKAECVLAPHEVSLSAHPSGAIAASIRSSIGLACPDPLVVMWEPVEKVRQAAPRAANHSDLVVVSSPAKIFALGYDFDGEFRPVQGVGHEYQKLFFAQLAGLVLSRALKR